jgi:hypothetical protein
MYGLFAGITLIVFRGFPYTHRQTGTYNYLYYQNLTNIVALGIVLLNPFNEIYSHKQDIEEEIKKQCTKTSIADKIKQD